MRALFDNLLNDAVLTASGDSQNYPVTNIIHRFMKKRFQPLTNTSLITAQLSQLRRVNCVFLAYHTASNVKIKLYNGVSLVHSEEKNPVDNGPVHFYFNSVMADKITVEIYSAGTLFVGTVWVGEYIQLPNFLSSYKRELIDNSAVSSTADSQTSSIYVKPLESFEFTFPECEVEMRNSIIFEYISTGIGNNFFIHPTENSDLLPPCYVSFQSPPTEQKTGRTFQITINVKESR